MWEDAEILDTMTPAEAGPLYQVDNPHQVIVTALPRVRLEIIECECSIGGKSFPLVAIRIKFWWSPKAQAHL